MRLCDVIVGREVFGRLPLKDIEQIRVQRFTSGKKIHQPKDATERTWKVTSF
jgi:hypothetical protein